MNTNIRQTKRLTAGALGGVAALLCGLPHTAPAKDPSCRTFPEGMAAGMNMAFTAEVRIPPEGHGRARGCPSEPPANLHHDHLDGTKTTNSPEDIQLSFQAPTWT